MGKKKKDIISEVVGEVMKLLTIVPVSQLKKSFFQTLFFHHYLENTIVFEASKLIFLCINTTKCFPGVTTSQDLNCK